VASSSIKGKVQARGRGNGAEALRERRSVKNHLEGTGTERKVHNKGYEKPRENGLLSWSKMRWCHWGVEAAPGLQKTTGLPRKNTELKGGDERYFEEKTESEEKEKPLLFLSPVEEKWQGKGGCQVLLLLTEFRKGKGGLGAASWFKAGGF